MNTAPDSKRPKGGEPAEPVPRITSMIAKGQPILLPDIVAAYLTEWLMEIGPTVAGAMGEAPIGWRDLSAWQENIGIELDPFEARTIRRMSEVYLAQRHDARKPACPAPYTGREDVQATRDRVSAQFKAMWDALAERQAHQ